MTFYFYQKGKETYLTSEEYYPINNEYFDIPEGETIKTLIEQGKIIMSNSKDLIEKFASLIYNSRES
jgi:hypothetical protein